MFNKNKKVNKRVKDKKNEEHRQRIEYLDVSIITSILTLNVSRQNAPFKDRFLKMDQKYNSTISGLQEIPFKYKTHINQM